MKTAESSNLFLANKEFIKITEVGLRDGLQNIKASISTQDKISLGKMLIDAGIKELEITSFVNPKWVPQMADANEVVQSLDEWRVSNGVEVKFVGLAPNLRGVQNGLRTKIDAFSIPISVSEKHNISNVNKTINESFVELENIVKEANVPIKVGLATSFGSPYSDELITPEKVATLAKRAMAAGASHVILSDTVGSGNPVQVSLVLDEVLKYIGIEFISLHFHNTRGMGLANVLVGLHYGIKSFESSIGGLGGCPFVPGAAGNIATEDLCYMLDAMGYKVPIDLNKLQKADEFLEAVGLELDSTFKKHNHNK